jgi:hypothetical protein
MEFKMYQTNAHDISLSSNISWAQYVTRGHFNNKGIETEMLNFLSELSSMEATISEEQDKIFSNDELSDLGRAKQIKELAGRTIKPMLKRIEEKLDSLNRGRENLLKDVQGYESLPDNADSRSAVREQEIRSHFRDKPAGEILKALQEAEENEDYETLRAIEQAPRSIMLEPKDQIQAFRIARLKRSFPSEMGRYEDWGKVKEILQAAQETLARRLLNVWQKLGSIPGVMGPESRLEHIKKHNEKLQAMR